METKPRAVLLGGKYMFSYVFPDSLIRQIGEEVSFSQEQIPLNSADELMALAGLEDVRLVFGTWGVPKLDAALLDRLPNLAAVFYAAGSVRGFVTDEVWKRGIRIFSAARVNAVPVAEFTLAQILTGLKQTQRLRIRDVRDWSNTASIRGSMRGNFRSRVGLISYGSIARLVRKYLLPFDHEIHVYDPFMTEAEAQREGVTLSTLEEIFRECHAVSLHTPLLPETVGMIRGAHFASMRDSALFINTARGKVIREEEMAEVFRDRPDLTAVLDVLVDEPPAADNPLLPLPNVHITPHIAGSMGYECERMGVRIFEAFKAFRAGEGSMLEVTEADMDRIA